MGNDLSLRDSPFVHGSWLQARLDDPRVRVIDIRGKVLPADAPAPRYLPKRDGYDEGHIPGAVFVDWTKDIVDPDDAVPAQIAPPDRFRSLMHALGIGKDTVVVAYDDYSHMFAGRMRWALRYYGHDAVRVLDGGYTTWVSEGRPVTREVRAIAADANARANDRFEAHPRKTLRLTADEVLPAVARGALLIDARSSLQFAGKASAAQRAGHIPGAKNVPYPTLLEGPEKRILDDAGLREAFGKAGIDVDALGRIEREVILYCNGGVSATVPMMALEKLGICRVALYDGSWNEWGNDPDWPIEGV